MDCSACCLYFGRSDGDELRDLRCSQCQTQRKPIKTGVVRNLVEIELRCPGVRPRFLGYSSENDLSTRSSPDDPDKTRNLLNKNSTYAESV